MNPVYLRLASYALSGVIGLIPAYYAGYVSYDMVKDVLTIKPMGLLTAGLASGAITGGIFAKWGVK